MSIEAIKKISNYILARTYIKSQSFGFIIETLLITNLWIFIYNNLLHFLNAIFPAAPALNFIRNGAYPEPFEIPLYLLLSGSMVLSVWIYHSYINKNSSTVVARPLIKIAVFFFLVVLFLSNLGVYPMARSAYPYQHFEAGYIYLFYLIVYLVVAILIVVESAILSNYVKRNKKITALFYAGVILFIALVTFEPRFPISGHDYAYFFGPIWEVIHGKTIYTQTSSQYGFAAILIFSLLYKIRLFNLVYLPVVVWFFYIIEYFLSFYFIYKVGRSLTLAVIGLLSIITVNYYSVYLLPGSIPQTGPIRWLPIILSVALFIGFRKLTSKIFIFNLSLMSFWVLDSGIVLILAYGFTLFLLLLFKKVNLKLFIMSCLYLTASVVVIFLGINIVHVIFGYQPIIITSVFAKLKEYGSAGFGMIPMDSITYFWFVVLTYCASILYYIRKKEHIIYDQLLLYTANLSLFACIYFVGRSHVHNLFHISIFPILNIFILFGLYGKSNYSPKNKIIAGIVLFMIFIAYPIYNRQEVMTLMIKEKINHFKSGNIFTPEWPKIISDKYEAEVKLVRENIHDDKIIILSSDDTYLFYLFNKDNLMNDNPQFTILSQDDIEKSLEATYKVCPKKIVTRCTLFNKCTGDNKTFVGFIGFSIEPLLLKRIEEVCKAPYLPTICTNQLCISEAKYQ